MGALSDLRRRWLLILTITAAAAGVVGGYSFTAAKQYRATALLVVSPVPAADPTFVGIDVLHDTGRATAAATAARLVRTPEVAEAVRVRLGEHGSAATMLRKVSTHVVGASDTVAVVATDPSAARAAQIANGFVDAFVTARSAGFQSEVASAIGRIQQRLAEQSPAQQRTDPAAVRLQQQLGDLRAQLGTSDPTVRHGSEAVQPTAPSWPHPVPWTIEAGAAGLGAGCLLALLAGIPARLRRRELRLGDAAAPRSDRSAERLADKLEQRLAHRLDALAAEQAELALRESALAAREQELAARADQARTEAAGRVEPQPVDPAREADLARREQELTERAELAERRERAIAERNRELRRLEEKIDAERQELERAPAAAEADGADAGRVAELDQRAEELGRRAEELDRLEQLLAGQAAQLAQREQALAQRTDDLEQHEARLAEQAQRLAEEAAALEQELHAVQTAPAAPALPAPLPVEVAPPPPPAPAPPAAALPAPPPPPPPPPSPEPPEPLTAPRGGWDLHELERLVEEHAGANPHRADEWRSYLFYLQDYVDAEGRVPPQFDWLVEDTFGELLAAR